MMSQRRLLDQTPADGQRLLFSATLDRDVDKLIRRYLPDPVVHAVADEAPTGQVDHRIVSVRAGDKVGATAALAAVPGRTLIFVRTKHGADRLAKKLARGGVQSTSIHGNRSQNQRNHALSGFQKGTYRVLVATDVAARGIHVEGIAHVVNYDLPQVPEDFIHRVGRTGRAGARGTASTFGTRAERAEVHKIERTLDLRLTRRTVSDQVAREQIPHAHFRGNV